MIGVAATVLAAALAVALVVKANGWPISYPLFLAYGGAAALLLISLAFAFWTYGALSLRYSLDRTGMTITWGPISHFLAMDRIQEMSHGRSEHDVRVRGIDWWGYHIGPGHVEGRGDVLFYSTHGSPEELVYVRTADATFGISPHDPIRFVSEANTFQQAAQPRNAPPVQRRLLAGHPIWADRAGQLLGAAAVALNAALWGFLFAVYPDLSNQITIEFPPIGDITTLQSRSEIMQIPATATAILALNLAAAALFRSRERAVAYLLLSGAIFFQVLFCVAAGIAVYNA
jgi:hypothetical protein